MCVRGLVVCRIKSRLQLRGKVERCRSCIAKERRQQRRVKRRYRIVWRGKQHRERGEGSLVVLCIEGIERNDTCEQGKATVLVRIAGRKRNGRHFIGEGKSVQDVSNECPPSCHKRKPNTCSTPLHRHSRSHT